MNLLTNLRIRRPQIVRLSIVLVLAVAIAYGTGWIVIWHLDLNPMGFDSDYGFPFPWRVDRQAICYGPIPGAGPCGIITTDYLWSFFILNVLFYMFVGYGLLYIYRRIRIKKKNEYRVCRSLSLLSRPSQ